MGMCRLPPQVRWRRRRHLRPRWMATARGTLCQRNLRHGCCHLRQGWSQGCRLQRLVTPRRRPRRPSHRRACVDHCSRRNRGVSGGPARRALRWCPRPRPRAAHCWGCTQCRCCPRMRCHFRSRLAMRPEGRGLDGAALQFAKRGDWHICRNLNSTRSERLKWRDCNMCIDQAQHVHGTLLMLRVGRQTDVKLSAPLAFTLPRVAAHTAP